MSSIGFINFWHFTIFLISFFSLDSSASVSEVNLALHQLTHESSTANGRPSIVVDGMRDISNQCWRSSYENHPWWTVHLQEVYKIKRVKIHFNPYTINSIWSLSVYVHMLDKGQMTICKQDINMPFQEFILAFCQGKIGQFVTVKLDTMGVLELCEVEVFGEKPFQLSPGDIVSRHYCHFNKKASQVINTFSTRSTLECAVLCTQTDNCDTFHFETNADKKLICQLKQTSTNGFLQHFKQDYNVC